MAKFRCSIKYSCNWFYRYFTCYNCNFVKINYINNTLCHIVGIREGVYLTLYATTNISTNNPAITGSCIYPFSSGMTAVIQAFQTSGAALNTLTPIGANVSSRVSFTLL